MLPKPDSVIITSFTPEQYSYWFCRKNPNPDVRQYLLVRLIAPRRGPGSNCFLLVPYHDPVRREIKFVMWSVVQVPTDPIKSASAGCHYYIEDDEQFALCRGDLETILRSIAAEEFYDVMDFHVIDDLEKFNINIGR